MLRDRGLWIMEILMLVIPTVILLKKKRVYFIYALIIVEIFIFEDNIKISILCINFLYANSNSFYRKLKNRKQSKNRGV